MARLIIHAIMVLTLIQLTQAQAHTSPEADPFSKLDWTVPGPNGTRKCGSDLKGVVRCDKNTLNVTVLVCHCMTFSDKYNTTVVGYCLYSCDFFCQTYYFSFGKISSKYTPHREGQLFGSCEEGYSPPVYSYSLQCVKCKDYKYNWLKYIAVVFLPLTVFYIIVVLFRISVTRGAMNGYILISQIIAAPFNCRMIKLSTVSSNKKSMTTSNNFNMFTSLYMVWNLDIFRPYFADFCLTPQTTTLQTFALEYTIAVYPLLLIVVTYIFVKLHDRYSVVVRMWSPFYWCFARIRREWEMHDSLIGAFSTFLLLSYVKIVNISFDLLTPTALYDVHGHKMPKLFLYYDGTYEYFGKDHLPYAFLALFMLLVFNVSPLVLLCLWPCRCFHKCLNHFRLQFQLLHVFMDTFHGCYRLKPRDYRCFAAFYLLLRIAVVSLFTITRSPTLYGLVPCISLLASLLVAIARPYKKNIHNAVDALFLGVLTLTSFGIPAFGFLGSIDPVLVQRRWYVPSFPVLLLAPLYGLGLLAYNIIPKRVSLKLKALVKHLKALFEREQTEMVTLPYRFHHSEEYPPLLPARRGQPICVTRTISFEH